jgi:hypothetical protein
MQKMARRFFLLLALLVTVLAGSACSTTESENASSRPWNAPKGWENGLPTDINRGR